MRLSGHCLASDHYKVYYDLYKSNHEEVIIIAHGFFNSKQAVLLEELARVLNNDYDVILFDFRGHGQSQELFYWTTKEYLDLLAIIEFASKHYKKIGVIGFSLGASTSIIAASKTAVINSIVSISAPLEFKKIDCHLWQFDIKNDLI